MTAVVALPVTVPRVPRRAGRRRALRVVLFLGGLLALGFLWGGQAYAVEAPPLPHDATAVVAPVLKPELPEPELPGQELRQPVVGGAAQAVRETAEPVAEVVRRVVRPVGELKDRVTGHRPAVPLPVIVAPVPELPVPELPVPELPVPETPASELPASEAPVSEAPAAPEKPVNSANSAHQDSGDRAQRAGSGPTAHTAAPVGSGGGGGGHPYAPDRRHGDTPPRSADRAKCGETPVQAPAGPCGDGVRQAAGDGSAPRSGDQHAAAFTDGLRFALVRGATLPATAAPTYDRPHEILEFPG
ncbi:hypothetical protein [Streptomyces enissocaesilis]|uniref:Uncharacterized protein n=1 Tax=Streptomyces enissocaesilis TaxID=332589 RepID=A0ABP6JQJ9_9ACTN